MERRYPPEIAKLLSSVDKARQQLRQEIERTRQLLREVEQQTQTSGVTR